MKLTIIIPIFNEEDNLAQLEKALADYLSKSSVDACVLFVNDGSGDNSQELIDGICRRQNDFNFIQLKRNGGISTALKVGFDHAKTEWIGYMDADLQTHPEDFELLIEYLKDYDLVTGIRTNRQDTMLKTVSSLIANGIRRWFTRDGIDDTGCPLKIIRSKTAKNIPMFKGFHRFLPALVLLQKGKVKQVPVRHFPRMAGQSKFGLSNRLIRPLLACFAYLWIKKNYIDYQILKKSG